MKCSSINVVFKRDSIFAGRYILYTIVSMCKYVQQNLKLATCRTITTLSVGVIHEHTYIGAFNKHKSETYLRTWLWQTCFNSFLWILNNQMSNTTIYHNHWHIQNCICYVFNACYNSLYHTVKYIQFYKWITCTVPPHENHKTTDTQYYISCRLVQFGYV